MPEGFRHRTATVRTLQFSEFRLLRSEEFLRLSSAYPDVREQMNHLAKTRARLLASQSSMGPTPGINSKEGCFDVDGDIFEAEPIGMKTLMQKLTNPDEIVMMTALSDVEDKNSFIQTRIEVLVSAQLDTSRRLEELQGLLKDVQSKQRVVRRSSVRAATKHTHQSIPQVASPALLEKKVEAKEAEDDADEEKEEEGEKTKKTEETEEKEEKEGEENRGSIAHSALVSRDSIE
jgi:hypothetical protein